MLRRHLKRVINAIDQNHYETYNSIEISRSAILHNLEKIQRLNPAQQIIPVIKSNAYGHGLKEVAQILDKAKVPLVAVDGYFEANIVLEITRCNVLVLGAIKPENARLLNTKRCSYVVQDIRGLEAFGRLNKKVQIHLELNTGMNRLGLSSEEMRPFLDTMQKYPKLKLEGIMSHLADADNPNNDFTSKQLAVFEKLVDVILAEGWSPKYVHLAQTAGSTKTSSKRTNAIRLGIGLYGINPLIQSDKKFNELADLQPALTLNSTIVKVQKLDKGDKVSYNGIFTAKRPTRIGVLPLGYYEGYPRKLSNIGIATYNNQPLPVVGRVCMNHTMIDITDCNATVGSVVTLINSNPKAPNSVVNICKNNDLFSYELVTKLSEKIRRITV